MSSKTEDLTGKRFGKMLVTSFCEMRKRCASSNKKASHWNCLCDCGSQTVKAGTSLKMGRMQSCSRKCAQKGSPQVSTAYNSIVRTYKTNARNRGYTFSLTEQECMPLFSGACYYCGEVGSNKHTVYSRRGARTSGSEYNVVVSYNGIDRVDNAKGYELGNVVPCCFDCNSAKMDMTHDDFLALCIRVAKLHPEQLDTHN